MRISLNSAIILLLAIFISTGILLYPASVNCTSILKDGHLKVTDPANEPNVRLAEPGEYPHLNTGPLGSSQGISIDTRRSDLSQDYNRETGLARSRYMQLLYFYFKGI